MSARKIVVALALAGAVIVAASWMYFSETRTEAPLEAEPQAVQAPASGTENRELETEPAPELSERRFELPPSEAAGTYPPPAEEKPLE